MSVATKVHQDQLTGTTTIERVQDCTPVVNYAEQQRIAGATGSSEMRHGSLR
jgi:hypothetical protein